MKTILLFLLSILTAFGQDIGVGFLDQGLRNVVPDGLVGYWPMNDIRNGVCAEPVSNKVAYVSNSLIPVLSTTGIGAMSANTNSFAFISTNVGNIGTNSFSIAGWFANTNLDYVYFFSKSSSRGLAGRWTLNSLTNAIMFTLDRTGIGDENIRMYYPTTRATNGSWFFSAVTWDRILCSMYLDGSLVKTTNGISNTNYSTADPLLIGAYGTSTGEIPTTSKIASFSQIRLYNRALSSNEIYKLYMAGH